MRQAKLEVTWNVAGVRARSEAMGIWTHQFQGPLSFYLNFNCFVFKELEQNSHSFFLIFPKIKVDKISIQNHFVQQIKEAAVTALSVVPSSWPPEPSLLVHLNHGNFEGLQVSSVWEALTRACRELVALASFCGLLKGTSLYWEQGLGTLTMRFLSCDRINVNSPL